LSKRTAPEISIEVLALVLDERGTISRVVHEGVNLVARAESGAPFLELCSPSSRSKAERFLDALRVGNVSSDWELLMGLRPLPALLHWSGVHLDESLVVVGERSTGAVIHLFEQLVRRNHADAAKIAEVIEAQLTGRLGCRAPDDWFDDLSRINNELAATQREVARQNAALQRENLLLGTVAHDLRSPLGVIQMSVARMLGGPAGSLAPDQRTHLARIERSVRFLIAMVGDLVDLSMIESGALTLQRVEFDLGAELRDVATEYQNVADLKGIRLDVTAPTGLACVGDRGRLRQVLNNLIDNGIKFSRPGSHVQLTATRDGGLIRLAVRDQGQGIPAGELPRLFKPSDARARARQRVSRAPASVWLSCVTSSMRTAGRSPSRARWGRARRSAWRCRCAEREWQRQNT
jgi:signal transduction histidine kinase